MCRLQCVTARSASAAPANVAAGLLRFVRKNVQPEKGVSSVAKVGLYSKYF